MIKKYPGLTLRSFAIMEINIMLPSSRKSYRGKETTTALNSVLIDTMKTVDLQSLVHDIWYYFLYYMIRRKLVMADHNCTEVRQRKKFISKTYNYKINF